MTAVVLENFQNGFNQNEFSTHSTNYTSNHSNHQNGDSDDEDSAAEECADKLEEANNFSKCYPVVTPNSDKKGFVSTFFSGNVEHYPSVPIPEIIKTKIVEDSVEEEPFFIVDLGVIAKKIEQWKTLLPRVEPFYAVKCCPDPVILETMANFGIGFDCASKGEIGLVSKLRVPVNNIIMANPCKGTTHILSAKTAGVKMMTFDNYDELDKIQKFYPEAELVLRILPDDSRSLMRFGSKFGAPYPICKRLLQYAQDLHLNVIGVSFHVGSGCLDPTAFADAVRLARIVFDDAYDVGYNFTFLDIGGGFPGVDDMSAPINFPNIVKYMRPVIDELFPVNVRIIAEPGRYFAAASHTLAVNVYARRKSDLEAAPADGTAVPNYLYYINDGVYGSFNCIFFDHAHPEAKLLIERPITDPLYTSKIFGPTCDSLDVVVKEVLLPELRVGEWLYFPDMGAYTSAAASEFNGFRRSRKYYVSTLAF